MPNNTPYLCGGIFFDLLLQARKNRRQARDNQKNGADGLSDQNVMKELIRVVTGEEIKTKGSTLTKATSQYKTCEISGNTYIPFNDTATIAAFDSEVKNDYDGVTKRMLTLTEKFLNKNKREWLVKALLETIKTDETIPDETLFSTINRSKASKKEIDGIVHVDFSKFLVSVLHFILTTRPNNEKGKSTFEKWFVQDSSRSKWKFVSKIGSEITQKIEFALDEMVGTSSLVTPFLDGMIQDNSTGASHAGQFTSMVSNILQNDSDPFKKYLERTKDFYSEVKTLLYAENPRYFYDFYVCNLLQVYPVLRPGARLYGGERQTIEEATVGKISCFTRRAIISGTGGIGKSMMMRHLLLDSIENYDVQHKLPVLIPLKNYNSDCDLKTYVYQTVEKTDRTISPEQVYELLDNGDCILLLDGLDEIPNAVREKFEKDLEYMTIRYPDNIYIISSRPTSQFLSYHRFTVMQIMEFSKEQSLTLVDKLDFHDQEAKEKFREDLNNHLFNSHRQFATNPLLLTIMLMTYSSVGDIPRKMHIFYRKAFETMARLHDATKGAYKRPLHTKIEPEEFAEYFAEFCARTYKDEILEFTSISFCNYMDKVIKHRKKELDCSAWDFLLDLKDNLCIMYEEGDKYYFVHRSFQEYFTAEFYSKQMDDKLSLVAEQFKDMNLKNYHDKTFDMLYDMIPRKIDRFIFLPYLKALWENCDTNEGYWTYLYRIYPTIYSYEGSAQEWYENSPNEYFYDFIVNENLIRYNDQLDDMDWPWSASDFKKEFVQIEFNEQLPSGETKKSSKIIEVDTPEYNQFINAMPDDYEPDYCGCSWEIEIADIVRNKERYRDLITFMESDDFPLMEEYKAMRNYSVMLQSQLDYTKKSDDWFENF